MLAAVKVIGMPGATATLEALTENVGGAFDATTL
jgi:hypothetical protein